MVKREAFEKFLDRAVDLGLIDETVRNMILNHYDYILETASEKGDKRARDRWIMEADDYAIRKINEIVRHRGIRTYT